MEKKKKMNEKSTLLRIAMLEAGRRMRRRPLALVPHLVPNPRMALRVGVLAANAGGPARARPPLCGANPHRPRPAAAPTAAAAAAATTTSANANTATAVAAAAGRRCRAGRRQIRRAKRGRVRRRAHLRDLVVLLRGRQWRGGEARHGARVRRQRRLRVFEVRQRKRRRKAVRWSLASTRRCRRAGRGIRMVGECAYKPRLSVRTEGE